MTNTPNLEGLGLSQALTKQLEAVAAADPAKVAAIVEAVNAVPRRGRQCARIYYDVDPPRRCRGEIEYWRREDCRYCSPRCSQAVREQRQRAKARAARTGVDDWPAE